MPPAALVSPRRYSAPLPGPLIAGLPAPLIAFHSHLLPSTPHPAALPGCSLQYSDDGKIACPKCSTRVGNYNWSGMQCSCGAWITPAFQVIKSKVDEAIIYAK